MPSADAVRFLGQSSVFPVLPLREMREIEARAAVAIQEPHRAREYIFYHLTRQSLADMTGTTVETAIRIVSRWAQEGLLQDEGGRLALADLETLRELGEGQGD